MANEWDERYREVPGLFQGDADLALQEYVKTHPVGRAVDCGCGPGRNTLFLGRSGWDATGIDSSRVALSLLGERAAKEGLKVQTVQIGLEEYFKGSDRFDLVLLSHIHPDPTVRRELYHGARHLVARGGTLLIVGHHLDNLGHCGPPDAKRLLTEEDIREIFAAKDIRDLRTVVEPDGDKSVVALIEAENFEA